MPAPSAWLRECERSKERSQSRRTPIRRGHITITEGIFLTVLTILLLYIAAVLIWGLGWN